MDILTRKLRRDLGDIRGQVITIALVVASGVASYISLRSTFASIDESRDQYYAKHRFGDGFVQLKRAPETLRTRIAEIPGVALAYTRVTGGVRVLLPPPAKAATGIVVSIPGRDPPPLNGYQLSKGRPPRAGSGNETLLLEAFAERNGLDAGDVVDVVINGSKRELRIVGLATSPEFIYPMPPGAGAIPDDERFGVFWMDRKGVAPAFDMEGAFNDLVLQIQPQASERAVLRAVDDLVEGYGGVGAYGRDLQPSNLVLQGELDQLRSFATVLPMVFLGVAAFLLNVVLFRLIQLHRGQIATLKAVGYADQRIGLHYLILACVVVGLGVIAGTGLGAWFGRGLTELYGNFFRIPVLSYSLQGRVFWTAALVSLLAGLAGALRGVMGIVRMPPAEAMRPASPARYRPTLLERTGVQKLFGESARMVIREIGRSPLRTLVSAVGIAFAMGIMITGRFGNDMVTAFVDLQFGQVMREDMMVVFSDARSPRAIRELAHLPGVTRAEGLRVVPTRFRAGNQWRDAAIYGYPDDAELRRLMDRHGGVHEIPTNGIVLTTKLGDILGVGLGDRINAEIQQGRRQTLTLTITGLVDEPVGIQGHMALAELSRRMNEAPSFSVALVEAHPAAEAAIRSRSDDMPVVLDVSTIRDMVERFHEQTGEYFWVMTLVLSSFASAIAVGVIYNNARVILSVRQRDLASLRVLGFTKKEIAGIMIGELGVQVFLALPLGAILGKWGAAGVMSTVDPERFRFPAVVATETYLFAVFIVLLSAVIAGLLVRRRVYNLDLIGVLKTRE